MEVYIVVKCMLKMVIIMALGFVLYKTGVFDDHSAKKLSAFVSKISAPLLVIAASLSASCENRGKIFLIIAAGFGMYLLLIVFGKIITAVIPFSRKDKPLYECMVVCANCAFMGYPVLQSILGDEAVFYSSMLHFSLNIIIYTYIISMLKKTEFLSNKENIPEKNSMSLKSRAKELREILKGPGLILSFTALIIYVSGIRDSGVIYDTCYMVGNTTAALSMLILGTAFAQYPVKSSLLDIRAYGFAVIRLFIIPASAYAICRLTGINDYMTAIVTISTAMPVGSVLLIVGNEFVTDTRLITSNIVVSTLLSVITIPVIIELLLIY